MKNLAVLITIFMFTAAQIPNFKPSPELYPFKSNYIKLKAGKMHYIDEGQGEVILFVHGTPTWSFLYRDYVKALSKNYRCIAIDHIGFGLSDRPDSFAGTPEAHNVNLTEFIERLNLKNVTLVVHDFGGPIGLPYAINNSNNVKRIVMFNTWLWETKNNPEVQKVDKIINSGMGKFMYLRMNFSPKVLLKKAFYDKCNLTKEAHRHYKEVFPDKQSRIYAYKIAQSLMGSSDWYQEQWNKIDSIENIPLLILWGVRDEFFPEAYLNKWAERLPHAEVKKLESGHFVQEEQTEKSIQYLKEFLTQ